MTALTATVQRLIEQVRVTVTEQANWQSLQGSVVGNVRHYSLTWQHLYILQTSVNLLREKPALVELRWKGILSSFRNSHTVC